MSKESSQSGTGWALDNADIEVIQLYMSLTCKFKEETGLAHRISNG
ncbi:MAG: hypothetical protein VYD77_00765 [Actinomycetota bacterium]|nr:hypothetical protein [Actinomycetota bacterium]